MKVEVKLIEQAWQDIADIYRFISENDSEFNGRKIYEAIKAKCYEIANFPNKGHIPPELERLSIFSYLEINFKPYRIIYRIAEKSIIIFGVFDGRRNMMDILTKRLLRC
ncbi:MAG: type II toxin-antitoxin system RelE/ParE family toxin [Candidatus Cloacimonadales bacterium]|nr:type II toxin-antitoxin system RelE/ParE family toxin [Candidatus Cloacimonadales bacterium]